MAKLAFYTAYDKYNRNEAPGISAFVQLLRNSGNEVDFLTGEEELLKKVKQEKYDCVALSILSSVEIRELLATAIKVKKEDPFVITIIGGHGVDEYPDLINAIGVDMLIEGEGELVLPEVLRHIKRAPQNKKDGLVIPFDAEIDISKEEREFLGKGIDLILQTKAFYKSPISNEQTGALKKSRIKRKIDGKEVHLPLKNIAFNTGDTTVRLEGNNDLYPTAEEFEKMAVYPFKDVKNKGWTGMSLYVQKGCNWGKCSYCGITTPPGRRLPVHRVIELLEEAVSRGIKTVTFDDDQFIQNTNWTEELLDEIIKKGINKKIAFGAMIRVDSVKDKNILKKLGEANFGRLQIGVESFVQEKIRYFNKTIKGKERGYIKKAEELIYACLEEGIVPGVFIITSRPKQKNAILEISKELLKISRIIKKSSRYEIMPVFSFNDMLMAYPGVPLLKTEGYRKVLAPLRPVKEGNKIKIEKIEIPYAFKYRSMALANFIGTHLKISRQRGVPGEVLNETWEHIEDLTKALEISASHLDTDIGIALAFIEEIGGQDSGSAKSQGEPNHTFRDLANRLGQEIQNKKQLQQLIIQRRVSPDELKDAVNRSQNKELKKIIDRLPEELSKEKETVTKRCREIMDNLRAVSIPTHKRVQKYLSDTKEELKEIAGEKGDRELFLKKTGEIKRRTQNQIDAVYPFLAGRSALESLIKWIDEFG